MRISVRRTPALQPDVLARMPTGEVLALSRKPLDATFLDAYGPSLEPAWSVEVRKDALGLIVQGTLAWVLDRLGVWAYDAQGASVRRVPFPVPRGMRVGGFALFEGDFIVAMEHDVDAQTQASPGVLMRLSHSGEPRWTTTLPTDVGAPVELEMVRSPRDTWVCSYYTAGRLTISVDAVLVVFANTPSSGIGIGYVAALDGGTVRYCTRRGPIQEVAGLGDGEFLVGYQGYGEFETLRYGARGEILNRWPSHGYCVVHGGDIRVMELRNDSRTMHLVRLGPRGQVLQGALLDGYYTSRPCVRSDGTIFFSRYGSMFAARDLSIGERLTMVSGDAGWFATAVVEGDDCLYVGVTRHRRESDGSSMGRLLSESHLVRVDL